MLGVTWVEGGQLETAVLTQWWLEEEQPVHTSMCGTKGEDGPAHKQLRCVNGIGRKGDISQLIRIDIEKDVAWECRSA